MIELYPSFYKKDKIFCAIQNAFDIELKKLQSYYDSYINQLFIHTADTSIESWERLYGLSIMPSADIDTRRSRVLAKMRVYTATEEYIKKVAASFTSGKINITNDSRNYKVTIEFCDEFGTPEYIEDFKNIFEEIIPAHYEIEYIYKYRKWSEVSGYTWEEASAYTWEEFRSLEVIENADE